ncbi:MAG TPA: GAF and ANTAR domain-containing protein, partial [Candidatus Paceibacterota bacterium]|nr:GAF and ANTAR domain-containing protein [Candidatus Paceibacterota bacterium]HOK94452.1 GAF and ANTAR domain-containing protein [Candidatus Pacearchaeota archaeon]HPQ23098.1 GAF and ANTAR domain-containing protein [Candidatus Paceibacterota bacterium]
MPKNSEKQELKVLQQIIQTISYELDLEEVLEQIVKIVSKISQADSCFIYLKGDGELILRASLNPHPKTIGKIKMKVGEGITGWVARERKTVAISEKAYKDERFKFFNTLPEDKYEAFLSVPIIYKDKILGVINVQHKKPRKYKKNEIALLETIAQAIGGAIENALLFSEKEALKEALETRKMIDQAKGILMKELEVSEEEAYKLLH